MNTLEVYYFLMCSVTLVMSLVICRCQPDCAETQDYRGGVGNTRVLQCRELGSVSTGWKHWAGWRQRARV